MGAGFGFVVFFGVVEGRVAVVRCRVVIRFFFSFRLFKLKKRYRNVLDIMFELLFRMVRYRSFRGFRVRFREFVFFGVGSWVVAGGEEEF